MSDALAEVVGELAGSPVVEASPVAGGDVNHAMRMRTDDGRDLFVKHHPHPPDGMYQAEADGLAWLAEAGALATPRVVGVADAPVPVLVLGWIERGAPAGLHDEQLGRGLAALHAAGAPGFGLASNNFIATIPQDNAPAPSWPEFYGGRRLEPLVRRTCDLGLLPEQTVGRFARLTSRLSDLCGPPEPPARLHGDLWGGNAIIDAAGAPVLIDPAVYGGNREIDLAMMRLFGGFSPRVFAAYAEASPPAEGHEDRVALYQLWPLLVHVALFGGGYVSSVERALRRYT